jgi:aspartyl-tRNA(Asn)/glutamyl-tRNA(Gln) amidotransferase subunit B
MIGLEIHAELKTRTKMFCRCANDPDEKRPNVNICPVCTAQPGSLPVINLEAVKSVLRVGLSLGAELADFTEWDRKNYFYPDIPKGYQISQYKYPLVQGGKLNGVDITRIHLEEDTAKSLHDAHDDGSLIDFNRAGVPLMELVTEPVITTAKEAGDFARELQLLLRYLGVSEANMEKGQMRVEANISIRPEGQNEFGTKVEVKNLNSFKSVEKAIEYELARQEKALENGEKIVQSTRGWNEIKMETFLQREKESSHDYRYFPDPDLPKMHISQIPDFQNLEETLPELPWQKRDRYRSEYGIKDEDIESFVADEKLSGFFDELTKDLANDRSLIKLASNYITSDLIGLLKNDLAAKLPSASNFADLIKLVSAGEISSRGAKDILAILLKNDASPKQIATEKGLLQQSDEGAIGVIVDAVIAANQKVFDDYRGGNDKLLQFLIGQAMKESKGSANPGVLAKMFAAKK